SRRLLVTAVSGRFVDRPLSSPSETLFVTMRAVWRRVEQRQSTGILAGQYVSGKFVSMTRALSGTTRRCGADRAAPGADPGSRTPNTAGGASVPRATHASPGRGTTWVAFLANMPPAKQEASGTWSDASTLAPSEATRCLPAGISPG